MSELLEKTKQEMARAEELLKKARQDSRDATNPNDYADAKAQIVRCEYQVRYWRNELSRELHQEAAQRKLWVTSYGFSDCDIVGTIIATTKEEAVREVEKRCEEEDGELGMECNGDAHYCCTYWGPTEETVEWLLKHTCTAEDIAEIVAGTKTLVYV